MPDFDAKEKLEQFAKGVLEMQKRQDAIDAKLDGYGENKEALEKAKAEVESLGRKFEKQESELRAQEKVNEANQKAIEALTKSANQPGGSNGQGQDRGYEEAMSRWMKKGIEIPEEIATKAAESFIRNNVSGLSDAEVQEISRKDLLAGSAPDGGFFLSNDRASRMSERIFETSPLRGLCSEETTTSDVWEILVDDDEADSGWVGEVQSRPSTDSAKVALIKIPVHELYAEPKASQKIIDDAGFDIAGWHQRKVAEKFSRDENTAFVVGDGADKPKGFLSYANWASAGVYQRDAVEQIETAASGTIAGDDLIELQGSLLEAYQPNAVFATLRQTFYNNMLTLKTTDGYYLFNPVLLRDGSPIQLLGKPVVFFSDMQAVAGGNKAVAYADWSRFYTIVDRIGIRILRDALTQKPFVKFYTTKRVGGAVTNYQAGKLLAIKS